MAGYAGYSMSNNAVDAYDRGLKPMSKITKDDLPADISVAFFRFLVREGFVGGSEWHHTSKKFNRTDFFDVDDLAADFEAMRRHQMVLRDGETITVLDWRLGRFKESKARKDRETNG